MIVPQTVAAVRLNELLATFTTELPTGVNSLWLMPVGKAEFAVKAKVPTPTTDLSI